MLELALKGSKKYYLWVLILLGIIGIGFLVYLKQFFFGLGITGLSRDVSWGLYIAQLTYLVGIAAGGVMVVLPYYLHDYKAFGKVTILGEFLAVAALIMCMLFVVVDLGQPARLLNMMLHPTPTAVIFWDFVVISAYLVLNIFVGWIVTESERNGVAPPKWIKPFIYVSIPFAIGIHTVTAFLYCGLPGRHFWLTAILAPRFLASAFAAGPAVLIILCYIIRRTTSFDPGKKAILSIAQIVKYALFFNLFFFGCEIFVAGYSQIPDHLVHLQYLFFGLHGHSALVPWMWTSMIFMVIALILLFPAITRENETVLLVTCILVFIGTWIDKGFGLITAGFVPSTLHHVHEYIPTFLEVLITVSIWALGLLILTVLYKIAISVKEEVRL